MDAVVEKISAAFRTAWVDRSQFDADPQTGPQSAADAYGVQDRVFSARYPGRRANAWKAGPAGSQTELAAAPIGEVLPAPAVIAARGFHMFGMEAEVAFRIGRDLPASAENWSPAELSDAVDEILVTIELCDSRLANWKAASPLWRLADFQMNGALITGTGTRNWRNVDFGAQRAELWVNGVKKADRTGSHPLGDPLRVLPWTAGHCASRGSALKGGDLVTTGSWTGMEFVSPGDTVLARFPGIGEASVRIG
jgi:2-keto-4-pentenoate hydratase